MDWFTKNLFNNLGEIGVQDNSATEPKPNFSPINKNINTKSPVFGAQASFFLAVLIILAIWVAVSPERFETVKSVFSLILNSQ